MTFISFHSNWALAVLLLLIIAISNSILKLALKKDFTIIDKKIALYAMIGVHIQLLLGFISYFVSQKVDLAMRDMGLAMKNSLLRLLTVEHPLLMIIGIVLITVGFIQAKKADLPATKFKKILIFYGIGLLLILSRIPWQIWGKN